MRVGQAEPAVPLPRNANGKFLRRELRDRFTAGT